MLLAVLACGKAPEHEPAVPGSDTATTPAPAAAGPAATAGPGVAVTLPPLPPATATLDPIYPSVSIPRPELRPAAPALPEPGRYELEFPARAAGEETTPAAGGKPGADKPGGTRGEPKAGGTPPAAPAADSDTAFSILGPTLVPPGRDWQILIGITPPATLDGFFVFGLEYIAGISDVKDRAFSETPELWR